MSLCSAAMFFPNVEKENEHYGCAELSTDAGSYFINLNINSSLLLVVRLSDSY